MPPRKQSFFINTFVSNLYNTTNSSQLIESFFFSEKEGTADKKGKGRRQVEDEGTPHLWVHTSVLISHNTRILNSSHAPFEKKKKKVH